MNLSYHIVKYEQIIVIIALLRLSDAAAEAAAGEAATAASP